jgi:spermidine synthase
MTTARPFRAAVLLAVVVGWISLSHEILWVRVITSAWRNSPMAFGTTLGSFLVGIAFGALIAPALQRKLEWSTLQYSASCLGLAGLLFWLLPGLASVVHLLSEEWGLVLLHSGVALVASLLGGILPMLARHGVADDANVGANVSVIYFANVVGATIGPLFTGFLLLDWMSVDRAILVVGAAGVIAAVVIASIAVPAARGRVIGVAAAALTLMLLGHRQLYDGFAERLHFRTAAPDLRYAFHASGRVGGVGVQSNGELFSDGLYDGSYNVEPVEGRNNILRAYLLPVLHANPRRVLQIGLGSGSWTSVIASYPDVESLTVVEINPLYVDAMQGHPDIAAVLKDPRVTLVFDDGRRWLRRHPNATFDAIVINGSWHWRAHVTHMLSIEFLRELRQHLAPDGLVYFNTTDSEDVARTAAAAFAHVVRFLNFVAASDRVFEMSASRRLERLRRFSVFRDSANARAMRLLVGEPLEEIAPAMRSDDALRTITEDNMATEFKANWSGRWWRELPTRAFVPERGWLAVLFP